MAKTLVIGDVHATPQEIGDCEALWSLVIETTCKYKCDEVVLLGDQTHTHDILNTRVIDFWMNAFKELAACRWVKNDVGPLITVIVGNHDQVSPSIRDPHSMISFKHLVTVVDKPMRVGAACYMPYYYNPIEFIEEAVKLKEGNPNVDTLFCHQTFCGASDGLGFYLKDSVEPSAVPFKSIIVGHIHKPMHLGKVWYVGSPRWRTLTDAETEARHIYVLEDGKEPIAIPTNTHCIKIYKYEDSEKEPLSINLSQEELALADLRITINGTSDYIAHRMTELKAKYNAKCRGVPIRGKLAKASESEGIQNAFLRFSKAFTPPNGTNQVYLYKEAYGRLGVL